MVTFKRAELANGLEIVAEVNESAESTALGFMVKTGARDEGAEVAGVSHFLEHMMFKGTARRSSQQVNEEFDAMGAKNNAFTSNEVTCYWAQVLPEFTGRALDLLADLMRPALRGEDFEVEKKVIVEEIALYLDRPGHVLFEAVMADHFAGHPMANSVLGTKESILRLGREQMRGYFEKRYGPGNVVLAAAGKVDFEGLVEQAGRFCGHWPRVEAKRVYPAPVLCAKRHDLVDAKLKRHYIAGLCPGPSAQDEARYAAMVLSDVLGDQEGSRLFWALIETGLADEADFSFYPHDHVGSFMVYASCDPERSRQVEGILMEELRRVVKEGLSDEEVQRSKNKIESATVLQGESPLGRMRNLAGRWIYNHEYRSLEEDLAKLESITKKDLMDVARGYGFSPMTIETLGPGGGGGG
ncbi:MAG: insulinase family protein [Phycisphaerales bacterium]|nr:insulinase family protein [Phycisphaerales bacterium]